MSDEARGLPPAGGHYRHAVRRGSHIYTAGQVGWNDTRQFPPGIEAQTRQALANLRRALESEGATLGDLVTVNAYLADLGDFAAYNTEYQKVIGADPPTRTTVGVRLAPECLVEISGVAIIDT